jgi:A/G-specific adenine glycosylase
LNAGSISERLLAWYDRHGRRDLPWQVQRTPYRVWISEVMLQQTQVSTVIPYYKRFMRSFPDVSALAAAPLDDVLHHWSGLGYYARGRNLHKAAQQIVAQHNGEFPGNFADVLELPGIGRSTAGAILALSRNERHPILDGNVKRVLARYHAVDGWPGKTAVANQLWAIAGGHTPDTRVNDYTQAIMDLGATLCTRSKPDCPGCPLNDDCQAHTLGRQEEFPGRRAGKKKPRRFTVMLMAHVDGQLYLERRPDAGIWGGLWSLPEISERNELSQWCAVTLGAAARTVCDWEPLRHSFTHYDLDILPLEVRLDSASRKVADRNDVLWYILDHPPELGLAAPIRKLIDQLKRQEENNVENRALHIAG